MRKIIGLMGAKGAGKDTAALVLIENRGFKRIGFADALYREAAAAFGITVEQMGERTAKELDNPALALKHCCDASYVACVLAHEATQNVTTDSEPLGRPRSPRMILQYWGTEYRRRGAPGVYVGDDNYWLNRVRDVIDSDPATSYVVTDVRFLNEYAFVKNAGGILVRVRRPMLEAREALSRASKGTAAHPSETELLEVPTDAELLNIEGIPASLAKAVLELLASTEQAQFA